MKNIVLSLALAGSVLALIPFAAFARAGSVVVDRVVAVVNGDIITLSDLQREEAQKKVEVKDERLLLEDMIDRRLQMSAAKKAGLDVTDKELEDAVAEIMKRNSLDQKAFSAALAKEGLTPEQYKSELREQMTLSRTFNKYVRSGLALSDAEIRSYYDRNQSTYALPEEIRVRHIFFRVPDNATPAEIAEARKKAEAALERVKKGEDFIQLVKDLSESEDAALGGDLGFMQRDQIVPEIEAATRNLKPGETAGPVRGAGGFHIIRLVETRKPVTPFEKVKDDIAKMLYDQKLENTYRTWLQSLRSDATIENRL